MLGEPLKNGLDELPRLGGRVVPVSFLVFEDRVAEVLDDGRRVARRQPRLEQRQDGVVGHATSAPRSRRPAARTSPVSASRSNPPPSSGSRTSCGSRPPACPCSASTR